jgi:hypothetical protein
LVVVGGKRRRLTSKRDAGQLVGPDGPRIGDRDAEVPVAEIERLFSDHPGGTYDTPRESTDQVLERDPSLPISKIIGRAPAEQTQTAVLVNLELEEVGFLRVVAEVTALPELIFFGSCTEGNLISIPRTLTTLALGRVTHHSVGATE